MIVLRGRGRDDSGLLSSEDNPELSLVNEHSAQLLIGSAWKYKQIIILLKLKRTKKKKLPSSFQFQENYGCLFQL